MQNDKRTHTHKRSKEVEDILSELSGLISDPIDLKFESDHPMFFIMGCARSGSTLVSQYLASTKSFCYPSNFISRFYFAPYTGSLLQKLMFDLDLKNELFKDHISSKDFSSELGKTQGALAPHEFWYYWRRFFKFGDLQQLTETELKKIDKQGFVNGLKSIQAVFDKPMFLKGMIANWHIPFLASIIPNSYFIFVKRDLLYNAQSLLRARESFFSDILQWYSFKPAEIDKLMSKDPYEQVVGQVYYTNRAVEIGLSEIDSNRVINVQYEEFCKQPGVLIDQIEKTSGFVVGGRSVHFESGNKKTLNEEIWEKLENALYRYEK